jgi:D-alanyl-lipoteichoic acid acyltransferase DltB (MBOAT superfamily)
VPFNSFAFLGFLGVVAALYWLLARRAQNVLLVAASYVFYAAWDVRFLALLVATTLVDYGVGRALPAARRRRALVALSLAFNLGLLAVCKYHRFFAPQLATLLARLGLGEAASSPWLVLGLPIGISFYTFQSLGYVLDVYRGRAAAVRDPVDFALFVAYFPQLVAGPIERVTTLAPQLARERRLAEEALASGLYLMLVGYAKKTVVADNLAPLAAKLGHSVAVMSPSHRVLALIAAIFYVYADFAGYSDIARGVSRLFGIELGANFRLPLFAVTPADFWRRWHASLSAWFRRYLHAPLAARLAPRLGRRVARPVALVTTMVAAGAWHGAGPNFLVFGLYHGLVAWLWPRRAERGSRARRAAVRAVFVGVMSASALFFFVPEPADWVAFFGAQDARLFGEGEQVALASVLCLALPLVALEATFRARAPRGGDAATEGPDRVWTWPALPRWALAAVLFAAILLAGQTETHAFVYLRF